MRRGLAAEYGTKDALLAAIRAVRSRGFHTLEAYTPCPVEEVDEALGARRSRLSIAAGIGGLCGAGGGYFLQWLLVAYLYPVDVGARPPHMPLPFLLITIEMGFLLGAGSVFVAFFIASRIFKLWDPVFDIPGIESATRDRFWLAVSADDPQWNRDGVEDALRGTEPVQLHGFGGLA